MRNKLLIISALLFFTFSCSKDNEVTVVDLGMAYAGLDLGNYVIYDVDSIFYDDFNDTVITTSFQLKELVAESYTDLEGDEAFKINRYKRDYDTLPWIQTDVWNAKLTSTNYQKVEENVRYIKLIFPVRDNSKWNGNSMNNEGEQQYEYKSVDHAELVGSTNLDQVLTVLQEDDQTNLINPRIFEEKFAYGIGLVYKRSSDKERDNLSSPWRGYDITMTLNSYGN